LFSAPPQVTRALEWAGFDVCTTASNHSLDQGVEGLRRTLETLDRNGLDYAGTARTQREARRPVLVEAGDATVGLVSQTYGTNGIPLPDDQPWSVPLIDTDAALEAAERASRAGADVVLVALHWGLEYQQAPTPEQTAIARRLLRSPYVDLVYGHHAHVVQPFDRVRGKWVAYGLGNMVAQQLTEITGVYDGVTARFTFVERRGGGFRVTRAEFIPTYVTPLTTEQPRMRLLRITDALRDDSEAASGAELRAALRRVRGAVDLLGAREGGLRLLRR
jgi:poly-gamma-glutamate synthesis protein (capsule biosynthesis protein)